MHKNLTAPTRGVEMKRKKTSREKSPSVSFGRFTNLRPLQFKKKKSVIERRHVKMVTFNLVERPSYGLVRVLVYVLAVFPSSLPLSLSLSLARSKVQTPINKSDKTQGDVGKLSEKLQL